MISKLFKLKIDETMSHSYLAIKADADNKSELALLNWNTELTTIHLHIFGDTRVFSEPCMWDFNEALHSRIFHEYLINNFDELESGSEIEFNQIPEKYKY